MHSDLSRRKFLGAAAGLGAAGIFSSLGSPSALGATDRPKKPARKSAIKLGLDAGGEPLYGLMRQLDVKGVCASLPATLGALPDPNLTRGVIMRSSDGGAGGGLGGPPGGRSGPWLESEVAGLVNKVRAAGLDLGALYLHGFTNVIVGNAERDRDIEHVQQSIRIAGRQGIPVLLYNFFGLRNVEGLYSRPGRGGAVNRAFDEARVKDQSPVPTLGTINDEQMWEHLSYFLKAVVPVAAEAGVRLAQHPNDPPVATYRGVADPFDSIAHWKRLVNLIPHPSNGIVLDTGVTAELGADVVETIRYFGERDCINHVHFRNVRTIKPVSDYIETFIDEGEIDMLAAMRAFHEVGFSHMLVPDHSPKIAGDKGEFGAWGYALGYIKALIRAVERP